MPLLDPARTVLLVCDVQEAFRHAIFGFDAMCNSIAKMVKVAKILGIPMIVTEQNPKALGSTVPELGIEGSQNLLGIYPKTKFSMVTEEVEDKLEQIQEEGSWSIQNYIIVGIESHICVLQTALDLGRSPSRQTYVLADAISSCNKQEVIIALDRIRQSGCNISTTESIIFQLLNDAKHPKFKQVATIVKEEKMKTSQTLSQLFS